MLSKKEMAIRREYLGGSEIHHLFSEKPYGCVRRLWFDKTGIEPDYPEAQNSHMARGTGLEPTVLKMLRKKYRDWKLTKPRPKVGLDGFSRASVDVLATPLPRGWETQPCLMEIKCPSVYNYRKILKSGEVTSAWLLQVQHYLGIYEDCDHAIVAMFSAENWDLTTFKVERDSRLIDIIRKRVSSFFENITKAPEGVEVGDVRCSECVYAVKCGREGHPVLDVEGVQNMENDPAYVKAVEGYREAKGIATAAEAEAEKYKSTLKTLLSGNQRIFGRGYTVSWSQKNSLDTKRMILDYEIDKAKYERPGQPFVTIRSNARKTAEI